jgi:hypothetical protein
MKNLKQKNLFITMFFILLLLPTIVNGQSLNFLNTQEILSLPTSNNNSYIGFSRDNILVGGINNQTYEIDYNGNIINSNFQTNVDASFDEDRGLFIHQTNNSNNLTIAVETGGYTPYCSINTYIKNNSFSTSYNTFSCGFGLNPKYNSYVLVNNLENFQYGFYVASNLPSIYLFYKNMSSATSSVFCNTELGNQLINLGDVSNSTNFYFIGYDKLNKVGYFSNNNNKYKINYFKTCSELNITRMTEINYNNSINKNGIINNNFLYQVNNTNGILKVYKSTYLNIYENLTCNSDNSVCYDVNNVCFDAVGGGGFYSTDGTGNAVCKNTTYYNGVYCNSIPTICSGSCQSINLTNTYGIKYESAVCSQSNCTNDCGILGQLYSDTLSSYQRCGFYDTDGCLEWSGSIPCLSNELSYNGICEIVNTSINYIEKLNFGVNPYTAVYIPNVEPLVLNNNLWNVTYKPDTKELNVITTTGLGGNGNFPLNVQIPYPETDYYVGFDCNYKSTIKNESIVFTTTINGVDVRKIGTDTVFVEDFIINGLPINKEKITLIDGSSLSTYEFKIYTYDVNNKKINEIYFVINHLTGEITAYDTVKGGTVLFTYSYTVGIQIGKIEIDMYSDFTRLTQNIMISVYRYIDANNQPLLFTRGVGTLPYKDNLATTPYKITLEKKLGEVYLRSINYEQIQSSVVGFSQLIYGSGTDYINRYEITPCVYATDGCYTARFYLSERLGAQFFSYNDLKVCKNTITASTEEEAQEKLSPEAKLIIALIVSGLFLLVALGFGFASSSVIITNFSVFGGVFFSIGLMIYFAVIEWVPYWLIGVMFLLSALTVMLLFKKVVGGGDNQ